MRARPSIVAALCLAGGSCLVLAYPLPPGSEARAARYDEWRSRIDAAERSAADGAWETAGASFAAVVEEARALGDRSLLLARAVDGLAAARGRAGRLDEAVLLYEESAALFERLLGTDQPRLAVTLQNLGQVYRGLARTDDARGALERAAGIFERSLGVDSVEATSARDALSALGPRPQLEPDFE